MLRTNSYRIAQKQNSDLPLCVQHLIALCEVFENIRVFKKNKRRTDHQLPTSSKKAIVDPNTSKFGACSTAAVPSTDTILVLPFVVKPKR